MSFDEAFNKRFFSEFMARRLSILREEKGMTLADVAKNMGMWYHSTVANALNGRTIASAEQFKKIAVAMGMSDRTFEGLLIEAKKAELEHSHGVKMDGSDELDPESIDAAFMARHNIPDAKKRDLMKLLKVLKEDEE